MYRNWYTLEEIILLSIWGMAYFQILNQSVPVFFFKIILFHETYRDWLILVQIIRFVTELNIQLHFE